MTPTLLLTGIGGSIGCHVFQHVMKNTCWDVVGIGSFRNRGLTDRIEAMLRTHPEDRHRLRLFVHDLRAPISDLLARKIGRVDYIINLAALSDVGISIEQPGAFIVGNTEMMLNVLDYARVVDPEIFLHISTDEVFGPRQGELHREWDPIVPSSPYAASKAAQEAAAICYWRTFKVPLVIVNMANNFGQMQSPTKFPSIVQRKLSRGETVKVHTTDQGIGSRFYIHSRNVADAFVFLIKNTTAWRHEAGSADRPDRYNIPGNSGEIANDELVRLIALFMGVRPDYVIESARDVRPGYDPHYGLDGSKLAALGWSPPVSFADSLVTTIQWQQAHPEWLDPS